MLFEEQLINLVLCLRLYETGCGIFHYLFFIFYFLVIDLKDGDN